MQDLEQAIYSIVHDSDMPPKRIAELVGVSYQVLLNKANPQNDTHKLTCGEALAIQIHTENHAILHAMKAALDKRDRPQKDIVRSLVDVSKEVGDVVRIVDEAAEDGKVTSTEKRRCIKEINEAINSLEILKDVLSGELRA